MDSASNKSARPDLRTLEGQLDYLSYREPDAADKVDHEIVNNNFRELWENVFVDEYKVESFSGRVERLQGYRYGELRAELIEPFLYGRRSFRDVPTKLVSRG